MKQAYIIVDGQAPFETELVKGCTSPNDVKRLAAMIFGEGVMFTFSCPAYGVFDEHVSELPPRTKEFAEFHAKNDKRLARCS